MASKRPNRWLIGCESNLAAEAPALEWGMHLVNWYSGSVIDGNGTCGI